MIDLKDKIEEQLQIYSVSDDDCEHLDKYVNNILYVYKKP